MKKKLFILVILFIEAAASADETGSFRIKETRFIRELYESGRYFDCIAETEKLQMYGATPAKEYFIYTNYFLAGQYGTVISNYRENTSSADIQFQSLLLLSGSYMNLGMYRESYQVLKGMKYDELPDKFLFTMFLRRVEPLIISGRMDEIGGEIAGSGIFLEDSYNFINLRDELQQYRDDGLKSPAYAAIMSAAVPGLGQVYSGYPAEGLISLLSVAATAAGGFYMKEKGNKSASYTLFCFSGLFYAGNIYGAYNSAEAANSEVLRNRHRNIVGQYGPYNPADYIDFERVFN